MPEQRRRFSPQFKAEAVQMVLETGKPIAEIARDLRINEGTLGNWVNIWRRENPEPTTELTPVERARVKEMKNEIRRLRMENEFPKSGGLLRADATVAESCALIHAEKDNYDITFMCRLMRVPRSTYYAWTNRAETPTQARRRALAAEVTKEFEASRQTSGCRRIAVALNRRGIACSVGLIADLMRELGLAAVQPRGYKRTTLPGDAPQPAPDLIDRDITATAPGTRLVGDITYLRTGEGWLYLATVIDLANRMVIGWQLAAHMRTTLVTDALQMAIDSGHVDRDAIFHSDRVTQYTSAEFAAFTPRRGIRRCLGRTGVCWDNAAAESFFAALKNEMYYRQSFATRARARFAVAEYIEVFYNRRRLHSTLGYRTPFEALTDDRSTATAAA
jgi:putative transposase